MLGILATLVASIPAWLPLVWPPLGVKVSVERDTPWPGWAIITLRLHNDSDRPVHLHWIKVGALSPARIVLKDVLFTEEDTEFIENRWLRTTHQQPVTKIPEVPPPLQGQHWQTLQGRSVQPGRTGTVLVACLPRGTRLHVPWLLVLKASRRRYSKCPSRISIFIR